MEQTDKLKLPYIMAAQAQKHVTHNEALRMLDALTHMTVVSRVWTEPPGQPLAGQAWLVPDSGAAGVFEGHGGELAVWQDEAWAFHTPVHGWLAYVSDEARLVVHADGSWQPLPPAETVPVLGINASANTSQRLIVSSDMSLFTNDSEGGHRVILNKSGASDTASLIFQSGYQGRAEFGLSGSDAFSIKTSPNGSAWQTILSVDHTSGRGAFTNPADADNLLINPDFSINQRAFAGGTLADGSFGFDRWKATGGAASINRSGGLVTLSSGTVSQIVELYPEGTGEVCLAVEGLLGGDLSVSVAGANATLQPGYGPQFTVASVTGPGPITVSLAAHSGAASFTRVSLVPGNLRRMALRRHPLVETRLCQRYYCNSFSPGVAPADSAGSASYHTSISHMAGHAASQRIVFPERMREAPTLSWFAPDTGNPVIAGRWQALGPGANYANATAMSALETSPDGFIADASLAQATLGDGYLLCGGWSAEAEL